MERSKEEIVFIPDISGFSNFVKATDSKKGAGIISQLLDVILQNICLSFDISEIEGDAVLFYKFGKPFSIPSILSQYEALLDQFNVKLEELAVEMPAVRKLSLKLIVHYGVIE